MTKLSGFVAQGSATLGRSGNLHALLNEEGELHDADTVFLRDRIRVAGLSIHEGIITVAVIERPPGAPFSEAPSILVIRRFRLAGEALEEIAASAVLTRSRVTTASPTPRS